MKTADTKNNPHNINWEKHSGNSSNCDECIAGYPTACACGGVIHAEHVGKSSANPTGLWYNCCKCGSRFLKAGKFGRNRNANYYRRPNQPNEPVRKSGR
jgi:hypothetical protein